MPTYEYECDECGHKFDNIQKFSDPILTDCPECKEPKLRKLISMIGGIIFKGTGFYATDYQKKEYREAAAKDTLFDKVDKAKQKGDLAPKSESKPVGKEKKMK